MDVWTFLLAFNTLQGFLFSALIAKKKGAIKDANIYLSLLLFAISVYVSRYVLVAFTTNEFSISIFLATQAVIFSFGPLLYLYTRSITGKAPDKKTALKHLSIFFIALLAFLPFLFQDIIQSLEELGSTNRTLLQTVYFSVFGAQILHMLVYNIWAVRILNAYNKGLVHTRSFINKKETSYWLKQLIIAYSLILGYGVFYYSILVSGAIYAFNLNVDFFIAFSVSLSIHLIAIKTFLSPETTIAYQTHNANANQDTRKYQSSSLKEADLAYYERELIRIMETDKPYLNNQLRLTELAEFIQLSTHQLSQVINQQLSKSFFDFVNEYRVMEAKRLLREKNREQDKLLSIAYDAGFNSKAAFNRAFKKHAQISPSKFRMSG